MFRLELARAMNRLQKSKQTEFYFEGKPRRVSGQELESNDLQVIWMIAPLSQLSNWLKV